MTVADTYVVFTPEEFHKIFDDIQYIIIKNEVYFRDEIELNGHRWTAFQAIIDDEDKYTFTAPQLEEPVIYDRNTHGFILTGAPKFPKFKILDIKKFDHI